MAEQSKIILFLLLLLAKKLKLAWQNSTNLFYWTTKIKIIILIFFKEYNL